ncbi:ZIP zinc transporter-domain-containing protein [Tricharina praecox]|uniref:ZIP zinc transporter-domain-containing protein n=1 Tax=Tricharina praecox TaxID=43433 RepID=UPI002220C324|nr:ZIP zinc transporter-domain-containing protein [Tricharina praecox]KAI5856877.1 ZIP zinc transporter-domain-containing protein [Tricharina praecox]
MMFTRHTSALPLLALLGAVHAQSATSSAASPTITSLDDCHLHDLVQLCMPKPAGEEVVVTTASNAAAATALPTAYNDCHTHDGETFCVDAAGNDVFIEGLSGEAHEDHEGHDEEEETTTVAATTQQNCHFHAGVEHCTGGTPEQMALASSCARVDRKYNIPLRIGSIFIVLATSAISVFLPLLLRRFTKVKGSNIAFTLIKQFGTGVIIATAFVHLLTHADLMFTNDCVGELKYEATTTAVVMAGLLLAFSVEYAGNRIINARNARRAAAAPANLESSGESPSASIASGEKPEAEIAHSHAPTHAEPGDDKLSVLVMEMGIIFHSILIGITLVVAGDSVFKTLLVVIIFHQGFEGLALGTRIAGLSPQGALNPVKILLATMFALITPIGMAIGIGVRNYFNGNDRETLIALGTLDALSAGILVWVGCVEMLAGDWMGGELRNAGVVRTLAAAFSLLAGLVLMSLLGKWA